jgi:hypothetical protein
VEVEKVEVEEVEVEEVEEEVEDEEETTRQVETHPQSTKTHLSGGVALRDELLHLPLAAADGAAPLLLLRRHRRELRVGVMQPRLERLDLRPELANYRLERCEAVVDTVPVALALLQLELKLLDGL